MSLELIFMDNDVVAVKDVALLVTRYEVFVKITPDHGLYFVVVDVATVLVL